MSGLTLSDPSKKMRKLDFAMMDTRSATGGTTSRPMSNNGDVEYEGHSFFFADGDSRKIRELRAAPRVTVTYTGAAEMLGGPPLFVAVEGAAALIESKASFAEHWTKELDRYFPDGIDTPGLTLIRVDARAIRYWDGDEGSLETEAQSAETQ